jgi:Fic family protein
MQDEISYFKNLEEIYKQDAYNSLSIEGFQVTPELIERVKNNEWDPNLHLQDADQRNALAARGYYEAFQSVKKTIHDIISTQKNSGELIGEQLQNWFQALFAPSVRAGIIDQTGLLGYRRHRVHIRNSRHVPPPPEALVDAMETFFDCLKKEIHAGVRVILGHYIFVFIHPFMDGNGRIGRFLMNAMFASGNYPWVIVPLERRQEYMNSLEIAGAETDILPFTRFIISLLPK